MENSKRALRLKLNTASSLIFQITTLVCGFILPRLILDAYGSTVNGLVNSITQFLQVIVFLELGVGAVVQSALYKPLSQSDSNSVSKIVASAGKFFRRIAYILSAYIVVLVVAYPWTVSDEFDWLYTVLMILVLSITFFSQYFFGVVDRLLLSADQRGYVQFTAQTVTLIANTAACWILIKLGAGIHIVKLTTSIIYLVRPLFLRWYVTRHYEIDRKIKYDKEPIAQKWNGIAQHIAAVVLDSTDIIVLTAFSALSNVSIYSVYHSVIYGVKNLLKSLTGGIQSLIGELWAKQELASLKKTFGWFEWLLHTGTVFIFGCTGVLILPFVTVYTKDITDANYMQPLFAVLLTLANAGHCLRLPYSVMILAAGHYKQTQSNYIIAAVMNIVLSVILVIKFGLIGVAVGTLAAMLFQTIWMARYISKNLIKWPFKRFCKQVAVDVISVVSAAVATFFIELQHENYLWWVIMAVEVAAIWLAIVFAVNMIFYRPYVLKIVKTALGKLHLAK